MRSSAKAGMSTLEVDEIARLYLKSEKAVPAPAKLYGFPAVTCISISPVAAHGIPNAETILEAGMLVNFDVSVGVDGIYADNGGSFCLPPVPMRTNGLLHTALNARDAAINVIEPGVAVKSIGAAAEQVAQDAGFTIARALVSHGVGRGLHVYPGNIANYPREQERRRIKEGWVVAIEPFVTSGNGNIVELDDNWSLETEDRAPIAQFEHTVLVTANGHEILTIPG